MTTKNEAINENIEEVEAIEAAEVVEASETEAKVAKRRISPDFWDF